MAFTLRQVRYFVATAETGQISLASQRLNITQSAITIAIKQLEEIVHSELFLRLPTGMILTESGHLFLKHCYEIQDRVDAAMNVRNLNQYHGEITIAGTGTIISYFLPTHLNRIQKLYPNLTVKLFEISRKEIEQGLVEGSIDLAVLLSSNVNNPALVVRDLFDSTRRLWLPEGHRLLQQEFVSFADITNEPYVMLTFDEAENWMMNFWETQGQSPDIILRTSSVEAVRSMVANGSGLTILSDAVYRPWSLEGKRIHNITLNPSPPPMAVGVAWAKDREPNAITEHLINYFIKAGGRQSVENIPGNPAPL